MSESRPSALVRSEIADLADYIAELPAEVVGDEYVATYVARMEVLRTELVGSEAQEQAHRLGTEVQVLRVSNGVADSFALPLDYLGSLCKHWHSLAHSAVAFLASSGRATLDQSLQLLALPASPGSYALGIAIRHPSSVAIHDSLAALLALTPSREALAEHLAGEASMDRRAFEAVLSGSSGAGVDLSIALFGPHGRLSTGWTSLSHLKAARVLALLAETDEVDSEIKVTGRLVAASLTKSRLEFESAPGAPLLATVSDPSTLRGKRLGSNLEFTLRERKSTDLTTGTTSVTRTILAIDDVAEMALAQSDLPPIGGEAERRIVSELVPEGNDLRKVRQFIAALADGGVVAPEAIGVTTARWVYYYRNSAQILGYVDARGALTAAGQRLSKLEESMFYRHAAFDFEGSIVGAAWLQWSEAKTMLDLDPKSADAFLADSVIGLSEKNRSRRANTLRSWVKLLRRFHYAVETASKEQTTSSGGAKPSGGRLE